MGAEPDPGTVTSGTASPSVVLMTPPPTPPQPSDHPLRASDADRNEVAESINQAYADGRLTLGEHRVRLDATWAARTLRDLQGLTADLDGRTGSVSDTVRARGLVTSQAPTEPVHTVSVLSSTRREGQWIVPAYFSNLAILGDTKLDMRNAQFEAQTCEINVNTVLGGVTVWVPDGVKVLDQTMKVMGDSKLEGLRPQVPGAPTIVFKGFLLMGDLKVYGSGHKTWSEVLGLK